MDYLASLDQILTMVRSCEHVDQGPVHHPEGCVTNHLLQCFHVAARESNDAWTVLAALTHDLGKSVEKHGHEDHSVKMLIGLVPEKTLWLVKNHMRVKYLLSGEMLKLSRVKELMRHHWFPELVALSRWDLMSRRPMHNKFLKSDAEIADILANKEAVIWVG